MRADTLHPEIVAPACAGPCSHTDCVEAAEIAEIECGLCPDPIGFEPSLLLGHVDGVGDFGRVHKACLEAATCRCGTIGCLTHEESGQ